MSGSVHEERVRIRFGDVDYARVLYFPRLFHFCHVAMEGFFRKVVRLPYDRLLEERGLGFPTVRTTAEYLAPMRYGEVLLLALRVSRIGSSSVELRFEVRVGEEPEPRARARMATVCVDMGSFRPVPVPADIREVLEAHLEEGGGAP